MALNKWLGIGRLTADPLMKQTQSGVSVARIVIAVDRAYQQGGERKADFISVVAWRHSAEFLNKYFAKGDPVQVEGRIEVRSYEDKDGVTRYATEVIADNVSFVTGAAKKENAADPMDNINLGAFEETLINEDDDLPF